MTSILVLACSVYAVPFGWKIRNSRTLKSCVSLLFALLSAAERPLANLSSLVKASLPVEGSAVPARMAAFAVWLVTRASNISIERS